ncbi:hypothetical protein [Actinomadura oligospora]|uniref:hypothetical protein n=1 Tax=Actinomadura oligospora TaxID=111804 RepID=UPI00047DEF37|nr:hypothetical protein [Actinomadura oligospora]
MKLIRSRFVAAAVAGLAGTALFVPAANAGVASFFYVESGNHCTGASFKYTYDTPKTVQGKTFWKIHLEGALNDLCSDDGYGGEFQWEGHVVIGASYITFGWGTEWPTNPDNGTQSLLQDDGFYYADVHFRACNHNPRTGTTGTCGTATGS